MSWRTNQFAVLTRNAARGLGLTRVLGTLFSRGGYEAGFDAAMLANVQDGDCAWDVGANVGHYTLKLCEKVGPRGAVFAFEPSSHNRAMLERALAGHDTAIIVPVALGNKIGTSYLAQGTDAIGATSHLVDRPGDRAEPIQTTTGQQAVADGIAPPNVIKIDTEGYELDVLEGLGPLLSAPHLRAVGVEVHFGLLVGRGMSKAPEEIERLLSSNGFSLTWTDASHVVGIRRA